MLVALLSAAMGAGQGYAQPANTGSEPEAATTVAQIIRQARFDALPDVLATYDGGEFTKAELSATLRLRRPASIQMLSPTEIYSLAPEKLRSVVSDFVFERLLVQKALEEGIDKTTSGIRERLEQYEDEVFNRLYYERVMEPELSAAREKMLREAYERDKLIKYTIPGRVKLAEIYLSAYRPYVVREGETLFAIAERECGDRKQGGRILRDDALHFPRRSAGVEAGAVDYVEVKPGEKLLVPLKADEMTSKERLAKKLHQDLLAGEDFMHLAAKFSEAPENRRTEVFDLDPMFDTAVVKAIEKAATTSVTDVLRTAHGFHILKVVDRIDTRTLTFDEVRNLIQLDPDQVQKAEELARKNLVERLRDKYDLKINHDALKRDDYQGTEPLTASTWIAKVGDFTYTLADFRRELIPFQKSWRGLTYQERLDFVKASPKLLKHLVKLESKSLGLQNDPQYRAEMDSKAIIDVSAAYLRQLEAKLPPITDAELLNWYESHIDQFTGVPKVKLREITKRVNPLLPEPERSKMMEEAKRKLSSLRANIKSAKDFEEMARRESDAIGTRSRGGLIGVVPLNFRGETFKAQIEKLEPGQISEPFLYGNDMVIIMVEEKVAAPVIPFEEAKNRVRRAVEEERRKKMREELREQLFKEKNVKFHI